MAYLYGQSALYGGSVALLICTGLAMQFFLFGMWAVLYTYTPEQYGTGARATGSGFASAIGRVGSLIGPYVVGVVLPVFGQGGVFTLGAISFAVAALAVWALGIETRGLLWRHWLRRMRRLKLRPTQPLQTTSPRKPAPASYAGPGDPPICSPVCAQAARHQNLWRSAMRAWNWFAVDEAFAAPGKSARSSAVPVLPPATR